MKNKIFMYLFFFAALFVIFQYMNQKKIFEDQESTISTLSDSVKERNDSIVGLTDRISDLNYFTLQGNENAMTYLENNGMEASEVEALITDAIYEKNTVKTGNPLVPYDGMEGTMRVNKVRFLNHKWILADFSDGTYWGELLIEYYFNEKQELELISLGSLLYPNI